MTGNELGAANLAGRVGGVPERFVPAAMHGQLIEAEHIARYTWAASLARDKRVLDAGCGTGYGSELLLRGGAAEVVAVDVSPEVIEAVAASASEGVVAQVADVRSLPFADDSFDLVVCFEVIEHVEEQDGVLDQLERVLRPDGLLVISSPNRAHYVPGNPHHHHEYLPSELRAALSRRFPAVRLLQQHVMLASVISPGPESDFDHAHVIRLAAPGADDEVYTLAIAGSQVPGDGGGEVALTQFFEVREWIEHIDAQDRLIKDQARALDDMDQCRRERQEALAQLADRETAVAELEALRGRLEQTIEASASPDELRELQARLDAVLGSRSWQIAAPLRAAARRYRRR